MDDLDFALGFMCLFRYSIPCCHNTHEKAEHRNGHGQSLGVCVRRAGRLRSSTDIEEYTRDILPGLCALLSGQIKHLT